MESYIFYVDMAFRTQTNPQDALKNATLYDFYKECTKTVSTRVLNVLDLPMGAVELPAVPQFW